VGRPVVVLVLRRGRLRVFMTFIRARRQSK